MSLVGTRQKGAPMIPPMMGMSCDEAIKLQFLWVISLMLSGIEDTELRDAIPCN